MKEVLSHKTPEHSTPSELASPTTNATLLLENGKASAVAETIRPEPVSDTFVIPTRVSQDITPNSLKNTSIWSRLSEQLASKKKSWPRTNEKTIKALILGTSESGKSTLLKSLKLYTECLYSREQRSEFKGIIFSNAIHGMRVVLEAMAFLKLPLDDHLELHKHRIFMQPTQCEPDNLPTEVVNAIKTLYKDLIVRGCLKRALEYKLNDDAE